jgi:hypothetical protein
MVAVRKQFEGVPRSIRRVVGSVFLGAAVCVVAASPESHLRATQEASAPPVLGWEIPADISAESIEDLDLAFAEKVNPLIARLFDSAESTESRLVAAEELRTLTDELSGDSLANNAMKRRLARRIMLISSAISASDVSDLTPSKDDQTPNVTAAVTKAITSLRSFGNGDVWVTYLHLEALQGADLSSDAMTKTLTNLTPTDAMNPEQRNFLNRPALQELRAALESALAAVSNEDEAAARADLTGRIQTLVDSVLAWEKDPLGERADTVRHSWRTLRSRYPAAAEVLRPVINTHLFNHNVHFAVSEELLSRLVADLRTERGSIAECIMGAWVTGTQTTTADVSVDIVPSATTAHFNLNVRGNTTSNTRAQKSPATVWTNGNHYFWLNRSVSFDGRRITASPTSFNVDTNSRTVGLATKYDRIPIVRRIVRNIASQRIAEAKPQADAETAVRLRSEAVGRFESETNEQFSKGNDTLGKILDSLSTRGIPLESVSARSSNSHLAVSSRSIGVTRLGGSLQPVGALMPKGAAVQLHQSAINNAIDTLGFQGRVVPEKEFVTELEKALGELFQREIKLTDREPEPVAENEDPEPPSTFVFSQTDPIRVRFENGEVVVTLRTGIRQEGREEIPEQVITIPVALSVTGDKVLVEPGNIAVGGTDNARKVQIKRILSRRVVRRELNAVVDLEAAGDKTLPVTVTRIQLLDGWLSAEMQ